MKISTKGRYALEAMLYMATQENTDEYLNIKKIVEGTQIPLRYLEQLLFVLRKAGFIKTIRGANGGYALVEPAKLVTAGQIIRAVEGDLIPVPCVKDSNRCSSPKLEKCITRDLWVELTSEVNSVIDTVTLEDLVETYKKSVAIQ